KLNRIYGQSLEWIKTLYLEAFPANERAPFWILKRRAKQGKADLYEIVDGDVKVGMAYVVTYSDMAYLFYFAVDRSLRGKQYGTRALGAILEQYKGKRIFLALENWNEQCDNKEQRLKRHDFYLKCGLEDLPYKLKEAKVTYSIMGVGGKVEPDEYKQLIGNYLGFPMKYFIEMRIIDDERR
ncbi:MAG: GNAT family N-acetyltransferase, partial [Ruminococcus sp.]|nr:GNAT family N-acetyltransferase [Ruminococcus sp.]